MRSWARAALLVVAACATPVVAPEVTPGSTPSSEPATPTTEPAAPTSFPPPPSVPDGPVDATVETALADMAASVFSTSFNTLGLSTIANGDDPRAGWVLADLMRFYQGAGTGGELELAFSRLTGAQPDPSELGFVWAFNHLIAWDLPAWDGYADIKRQIYTSVDQRWDPFFAEDHGVDWRLITWGGVFADDRPLGDNGPCSCIPSLDNPGTTDALGGSWYDDDRIVFGVVVNGKALALPIHQMEVHEMVNLTLGGRGLGIPYCTLCGSAQAYFTDNVEGVDRVVLRTSGLLSRSNKLMYDLTTGSAIDTFTGTALTGPLGGRGVILEQVSVVASTWGDWKAAHPDTLILAEDGGIGRFYDDNPLGDRDEFGPIFPVGDVDPRLPVQEKVVGVISPDGTPLAFPVNQVKDALSEAGGSLVFEGLTVRLVDSVRIFDESGGELVTHEAFWFAWSQFHPTTTLWTPLTD
ncbi:MAG: DUF3179 domain-containing (seleno)protein [Acidimicrobiia bacterium]|nr:DUF3179 domain-containing (seleno)protein [Acidimicrobiia bacterium]